MLLSNTIFESLRVLKLTDSEPATLMTLESPQLFSHALSDIKAFGAMIYSDATPGENSHVLNRLIFISRITRRSGFASELVRELM